MADGAQVIEIRPQPGPQEQFLSSAADIAIYGGAAFGGKMLRVDEPIPTPSGWTTMGELRSGDFVFGRDGQPVRVSVAHPVVVPPKAYRLVFNDGSEIEACSEHLWLTFTASDLARLTRCCPEWRARRRANRESRAGTKKSKTFREAITKRNQNYPPKALRSPEGGIRTTEEIVRSLKTKSGRSNHAMPVADALVLPDADLPIDPYLLGVWLGDGTSSNAGITSADDEVFGAFEQAGWSLGTPQRKPHAKCTTRNVLGFVASLRGLDLLNNKHIPPDYLRASEQQRLALLQGLMDTDGTCNEDGSVEFTTTSGPLAAGAIELILSLGQRARVREGRARLQGKDFGPKFTIKWTADRHVFRLRRKLERQRFAGRKARFRFVVSAQICEPTAMRCITVDAADGLYLAGKSMLVTHNTFGLLMEALRHTNNPEFGAVIFRREAAQITNEGGLWDTAMGLYPQLGGMPRLHPNHRFVFPSGARVNFSGLQKETDVLNWQGGQIALVGFDELTHFSRSQFFYMLSRNRSGSGVRPYIRATTNPDSDSWVAEFISWWIDQGTGYPIAERSGVLRWFVRVNDLLMWADSAEALAELHGVDPADAKSVTFIAAKATDNQIGLAKDPGYMGNLKALALVERERLLGGNWKIRPAAGLYFRREQVKVIASRPTDVEQWSWVRGWDLAATEPSEAYPDPDYTAGVLIGRRSNGKFVIADVRRMRKRAAVVRQTVKETAESEPGALITLPKDPGQAGKDQAESFVEHLAGFRVQVRSTSSNKIARAEPFAAQWQAGNVEVVDGPWNEPFFQELEQFPDGKHDDQVDAAGDAFMALPKGEHAPRVAGAVTNLEHMSYGSLDHLSAMG